MWKVYGQYLNEMFIKAIKKYADDQAVVVQDVDEGIGVLNTCYRTKIQKEIRINI